MMFSFLSKGPLNVDLIFCSIGTRAEKCAASNARNT
jgi:hypothetical protein